jgi:hypothetical protein
MGRDAITVDEDACSATCNYCPWFCTDSDPAAAAKQAASHIRLSHADKVPELLAQISREWGG